MEIVPLGSKLNFVDEIATLHHAEWNHLSPNKTIESRRATLISAAADEGFPTFYIAFKDNEFIGFGWRQYTSRKNGGSKGSQLCF